MGPRRRTILAPLVAPLIAWASRLRFPWLLGITVVLFVADLLVPDLIPFLDEIMLGLLAAILAGIRRRPARGAGKPAPER